MTGQSTKYFRSVRAISDHQLAIVMETNSFIVFDFGDRLKSLRWGGLQQPELFSTAHTDGFYILFGPRDWLNGPYVTQNKEDGTRKLAIDPCTFMDMVVQDKTRKSPSYRDYA
jgi:hypothetical protein